MSDTATGSGKGMPKARKALANKPGCSWKIR
ncbi:conserved protein of unknown function [Streptomyces sp. KY75]|nr:hypothetical protein STIB_01580 [Streptomyces sp. IB2014 011-1]CAD5978401.1 conserved protein of unknown function [Streptomyces sp. KY75]